MQYHLLNKIPVKPRWNDRHLLPMVKKFTPGYNIIVIDYPGYDTKYIISEKRAQTYPIQIIHSKKYGDYEVYDIPWRDLETIQEFEQSNEEIKQTLLDIGWAKEKP